MYKAAANVSAGTPFVSANLTAVSGGLGAEVTTLSDQIANVENPTLYSDIRTSSSEVASNDYTCSVQLPPGTYIITYWGMLNTSWVDGITDQTAPYYAIIEASKSITFIRRFTTTTTTGLKNLTGASKTYAGSKVLAWKIA